MKELNKSNDKIKNYEYLLNNLSIIFDKNDHILSNLSNFTAVYFDLFEKLNWCGFYFDDGKMLRLGPFQGKIACTNIDYNRGVCGKAFSKKETLIVGNVHEFEDHIACDSASNSEIVVPIIVENKAIGVFDIDSFEFNNFDESDKKYLNLVILKLFTDIINIDQLERIVKLN